MMLYRTLGTSIQGRSFLSTSAIPRPVELEGETRMTDVDYVTSVRAVEKGALPAPQNLNEDQRLNLHATGSVYDN
jgi:hypothetical protein